MNQNASKNRNTSSLVKICHHTKTVTKGPKTRRLSFLAFLFYHILHWIWFQIHFAE